MSVIDERVQSIVGGHVVPSGRRACVLVAWRRVRRAELALTGHLPAEAGETVLELATGGTPQVAKAEPTSAGVAPDPFTHPDAQRRFRVVASLEDGTKVRLKPDPTYATESGPVREQPIRMLGEERLSRVSGRVGSIGYAPEEVTAIRTGAGQADPPQRR